MYNLNQFYGEFKRGFQRSNRFLCQVYLPQALIGSLGNSNFWVNLFDIMFPSVAQHVDPKFSVAQFVNWLSRGLTCRAARLPSRGFDTLDMGIYGYEESFPYNTEFGDFQATFYTPLVGSDNILPRFFTYWVNFIHNFKDGPSSGANLRFPSEYYGTLYVTMLDDEDHPTITYKLVNAYPVTLEGTEVAWEATDTFTQFSVNFKYSYWQLLPYQPPPLLDLRIEL